jgi:flagellar basal-body rod protein FlgC
MRAQSERLRVVSENIANANSVGERPGEDPYRRKVISFKNELDRRNGVDLVKTRKVGFDKSDFIMKYDPAHPAANEEGYVKLPNVNTVIEAMDMREARRSYESNLNVIEASKSMLNQTISLLR